jgi:tetratricopeptide (TPR) repeat protein
MDRIEETPAESKVPGTVPPEAPRTVARRRARFRSARLGIALIVGLAALIALTWPSPADPDRVWEQAQKDLRAGRLDAVETAIARLGRLRRPVEQDVMLRAQLLMARERIPEALSVLDSIPDHAILASEARMAAGKLELRRDRVRSAEAYFLRALELDPKLVQARRELIYIYGMQLRQADQQAQFRALAEITPLTFDDLLLWSLPRGTGHWDPLELSRILRNYVQRDPQDRRSRLALAEVLRRINQLDEAGDVLSPLGGTDVEASVERAALAIDRGELAKASRLLSEGPAEHPRLALLRGQLALARKDPKEAVRCYRIAVEHDPVNRDAAYGLAQALRLGGDDEEADRQAQRVEHLKSLGTLLEEASRPGSRSVSGLPLQLGEACDRAGLSSQARGWYLLAIARNPLDSEAQTALFELDRAARGRAELRGNGPVDPDTLPR